jgi:aryl-alcohol dehydrogenase-like predicted oxidoreductase
MDASLTHLGLGTAQFGSVYGISNQGKMVSDGDLDLILSLLRDHQIITLDTAAAYGQAEQRLGQRDLSSFDIVTKIAAPETEDNLHAFDPERMIAESLDRLGISTLDAVLIHNAEKIAPDTLIKVLSELHLLVEQGICRKIGVSLYNPYKLLELLGKIPLSLAQIPFNVFDQRLLDEDIQNLIKKHDVEIHARSIFLQGLLLMEKANIPDYFQPWQKQLALWQGYLNSHGITALKGVMGFVNKYKNHHVSRFIVGLETPQQLNMIINSSKTPLIDQISNFHCDDLNLINPSNWVLS